MFVYNESGMLVGYDHLANNWYHEHHGCPDAEICAIVEQKMVDWARSLSGQSRRRLGKVGVMQGSNVNLDRLENE